MKTKHKKLYDAVDKILWEKWDPLGVNDIEDARDEYYSYIPKITELLIKGRDSFKITQHLYDLTTISMGGLGDKKRDQVVSKLLLEAGEKILN